MPSSDDDSAKPSKNGKTDKAKAEKAGEETASAPEVEAGTAMNIDSTTA